MNSYQIEAALATERTRTFQAEADAFRLAKQARRSPTGTGRRERLTRRGQARMVAMLAHRREAEALFALADTR